MTQLIQHRFCTDSTQLRQAPTASIEYWVARNGVFARGYRPELDVLMPISRHEQPIKGLANLRPYVGMLKLDPTWLDLIVGMARNNCPDEMLFHALQPSPGRWQLEIPDQTQSPTHCQPTDIGYNSGAHRAVVEIHSHGLAPAYFSPTDDQDESAGFRVYGVLGKLHQEKPELLLRVGLFGHFLIVPLSVVFGQSTSGQIVTDMAPLNYPYYQAASEEGVHAVNLL